MNSLAASLRLPVPVRMKLNTMVHKLATDKVGFGCLDLFVMTHETFYNVSVHLFQF